MYMLNFLSIVCGIIKIYVHVYTYINILQGAWIYFRGGTLHLGRNTTFHSFLDSGVQLRKSKNLQDFRDFNRSV